MSKIVVRLLLLFILPLSAASQSSGLAVNQEWKAIDEYSVESLGRAQAFGGVILTGECQPPGNGKAVFAGFIHHPPANPVFGMDAELNFLSAEHPNITWSRQANGTVRIVDSRALGKILKTKLRRIEITDAIDMRNATDQVLSAPEVALFLSQNYTQLVQDSSADQIILPVANRESPASSSTPKKSLLLEHVTLEEALDRIALEFSGAWVYCECSGRLSIDSRQIGIPKFWREMRR